MLWAGATAGLVKKTHFVIFEELPQCANISSSLPEPEIYIPIA